MKTLFFAVLLGLALVFVGIGSSDAQMCGGKGQMGGGMQDDDMPMMGGGMMGRGMMGGGMMGRGMMGDMDDDDHPMWQHMMGLGLDAKQKEAIQDIKTRVMKETIKKRADKQIAQIELKDLLDNDPVDMKAVEAKMKQIEALRTDIHLSHIKAKEEIKAKLTPDQKKKLKEMMETRHAMGGGMKGGMGMMHGRGGGMTECPCPMMQHDEGETKAQPEKKEEHKH